MHFYSVFGIVFIIRQCKPKARSGNNNNEMEKLKCFNYADLSFRCNLWGPVLIRALDLLFTPRLSTVRKTVKGFLKPWKSHSRAWHWNVSHILIMFCLMHSVCLIVIFTNSQLQSFSDKLNIKCISSKIKHLLL